MRIAMLVAVVAGAGCYAPSPPANVPCGTGDACPDGQRCVGGRCVESDPSGVDAPPPADAPRVLDATPPDGTDNVCSGGDNRCLVSCVATDPDCLTTCGDNRCVGNAGELCGTCAADCATMQVVCGNADCEPGEAPDCFADCGPSPWTWTTQEQLLITKVNDARTQGFSCPNAPPVTRPALTPDITMLDGAREWAWEIGHHAFFSSNGAACNGRTLAQRKAGGGNFTSYIISGGYADATAAFNAWMASSTLCPVVMSGNVTKIQPGVALEGDNAYVLLMK